jgi:hypothetical protein
MDMEAFEYLQHQLDADAAFEYWAPNKRFHFLSSGYFAFNGKGNNEYFKIDSTG